MSRTTNTTVTKEEAKPAMVPRLRFPEFREAAGWEQTELAPKKWTSRIDRLWRTGIWERNRKVTVRI